MVKILGVSYSGYSHPDNQIPSHGLVGILTNLKNEDVDGKFYNLNNPFYYGYPNNPHVPNQDELNKKLLDLVSQENPDMIFATGWMNEYFTLLTALDYAKKKSSKDILVVIGGYQPTWFPELTFKKCQDLDISPPDLLITGEGEEASKKILDFYLGKSLKSDIPGSYWVENSKLQRGKNKDFIQNLDSLLMPNWGLHADLDKHWPIFPVDYLRGCSNSCIMCAHHAMSGNNVRVRSESIISEHIQNLVKTTGVTRYRISGSELNGENSKKLSQEIIKRNLDITLTAFGRAGNLDDEALSLMKTAGFRTIFFGFESGSDLMLNNLKKNTSRKIIYEQAMRVKNANIEVMGSFMIGNPGETRETIQETIDFAKQLAKEGLLDYAPTVALHLIPCSELGSNEAIQKKYGYDPAQNWHDQFLSMELLHLLPPDKWPMYPLYKTKNGFSITDFSKIAGELSQELFEEYGVSRISDDVILMADSVGEDPIEFYRRYSDKSWKPGSSLEYICNDIKKAQNK